jgi:hypothetical protein
MTCADLLPNRPDHFFIDAIVESLVSCPQRKYFPLLNFHAPPSETPKIPQIPSVVSQTRTARRIQNLRSPIESLVSHFVNPVDLGFVPAGHWLPGLVSLSVLVTDFFSARSSRILRFEHKLWNALALTKSDPDLYEFVGVIWLTRTVLKVNRDVFGRFINVTKPAAALYNGQGSFATHGFREVCRMDVEGMVAKEDVSDVDGSVVRLFEHMSSLFHVYSTDEQVLCCRYLPREINR